MPKWSHRDGFGEVRHGPNDCDEPNDMKLTPPNYDGIENEWQHAKNWLDHKTTIYKIQLG